MKTRSIITATINRKMTNKNLSLNIDDRLVDIQQATRAHRKMHGCGAYTFEDGSGLINLVQSINAMRILELGTALGFTACCLAQGHESAHVDTIEGDAIHLRLAEKNIAAMGLTGRVTVHHGMFDDVLANFVPEYDAVFFDGYEPSIAVLNQVRNLLRKGGLMICANTSLTINEKQREIDDYLSNIDFWIMKEPIENGKTKVCVKT